MLAFHPTDAKGNLAACYPQPASQWRLVAPSPDRLTFAPPEVPAPAPKGPDAPPIAEPVLGAVADAHIRCDAAGPHHLDLERLLLTIRRLRDAGAGVVLNLGDLIEATDPTSARASLGVIRRELEALRIPVAHLPGNHCLDHLPEPEFLGLLGAAPLPHEVAWPCTRADAPLGASLLLLSASRTADGVGYSAHGPGQPHDWTDANLLDAEIAWLATRLLPALTVVAVHQRLDPSGRYEIRNAAAGRAVLSRAPGPVLVLHGHSHRRSISRSGGVVHLVLGALRDAGEAGGAAALIRFPTTGGWEATFV